MLDFLATFLDLAAGSVIVIVMTTAVALCVERLVLHYRRRNKDD
tara:strand:+ start:291 stop:422 length:132 start_codon:yes stop_codon:yes gene_type:complete